MRIGLLSLALAAILMSTAASAEIRVASWNLNNLHYQLDEPLRPGIEADIEIPRKYRDRAARHLRPAGGEWAEGSSAGLSRRSVGSVLLRALRRRSDHRPSLTSKGTPTATRAYAWSSPIEGSDKRRFYAVLHVPPISSPADAVRAAIVQDYREKVGRTPGQPLEPSPSNRRSRRSVTKRRIKGAAKG
jgi:hypothetical protein